MYIYKSLDANNINITPFQAFKTWNCNDVNASSSYGILAYNGKYEYGLHNLGDNTDDSSTLPLTSNNRYQYLIHDSLDHLFYDRYYDNYLDVFDDSNLSQDRRLHEYVWTISIPQIRYGERLRASSLTLSVTSGSISKTLVDDSLGNLIDVARSRSYKSIYDDLNQGIVGKWTFENGYKRKNTLLSGIKTRDFSMYDNHGTLTQVQFKDGYQGIDAYFYGRYDSGSFIRIPHRKEFNFRRDENYSIHLIVKPSTTSATAPTKIILTKNGRTAQQMFDGQIYTPDVYTIGKYPFTIELKRSGSSYWRQAVASIFDGTNIAEVRSTSIINDGNYHSIFYQKSGSLLQLYIDGILESSSSYGNVFGDIHNYCDVFVGTCITGSKSQNYSGSIGEINIYNRTFTPSVIFTGSQMMLSQSLDYKVGNVFYKHGMIVLTDPSDDYKSLYNSCTWSLSFDSTKTIYENEITCKVDQAEYNMTLNPTVRVNQDWMSQDLDSKFTSSYFNPYVTSVGLYNDDGDLLVVGKLSTPIKKSKFSDLTFLVKFDI